MLRAHFFGGLALAGDREPIATIPSRAARSLLAYLITYRDRSHTRNLLAGTFWPDLPDATARRRLRQALWQIRAIFSPQPVLLTEGDTVQLNPEVPIWIDVAAFEQQASTTSSLQAAVDLYRGEFLAGYYDDWTIAERERLHGILLDTLGRLTDAYKAHGDCERALGCARRLAAEDPWREEAHCEVMRLCHLLGRDAEALKQYELCCQVLAHDLDTGPSAETVALAAEIAARAGLAGPPFLPSAVRPALAPLLDRPDRLPLVGRQAELAGLLGQLEAAIAGHGGLTIIYGEAGVGKSRLLRELASNAAWRGVQTAWGRCYEMASAAYQPFVEVLRACLPALNGSRLALVWRACLAPLLPELTGSGPLPVVPPDQERRRLLEAIIQALVVLAEMAPHLILLDDTHWIDPASLEVLRYLLPRLADSRLLVTITIRSEELAGQTAAELWAMEDTRLPRRLELRRLDAAATGELVQRALGLEQPAPRFSARLYAETEGNPFFVVEALRTLVEEGLLVRDEAGVWSTPWDGSTQDYAELTLPAEVAHSIERRLARLPHPLGQALGLAAVIGRSLDFRLWRSAGGWEEEQLLAAADELCTRGLLLALAEGSDYTFAHDLIRRVAYGRLARPRRRFYHRRVAEALTCLPAQIEALAYHWTQAEEWDKAADCHHQAGDQARGVYAHAEAADHYSQALAAVERLPGAANALHRFQLHLAREAEYGLMARREAQAKELEVLAALAETLRDRALQARVALRQSDYCQAIGRYPESLAAVQEAVRLAQAIPDLPLEAEAQRQWGYVLWHQGSFGDARVRLETAQVLARRCSLHAVEAESLRDLGTIFGQQGDNNQAVGCYQRALPILRQIGDRRGEGMTLNNLGLVARRLGDYVAARTYHEQSLQIRRDIGDQLGESHVLNHLGIICRQQRDYALARLYFEQVLALRREGEDRWVRGRTLDNLARTFLDLGDYANAEVHFEQALAIRREIGGRASEAVTLDGLGLICHFRGDHQAAYEHFLQALNLTHDLGDREDEGYALADVGRALAALGRQVEAADSYRQALTLRRELGQQNLTMEPLAGLAEVALAQQDLALALAYVAEILGYLDGGGTLDGTDEPIRIYLICYQALHANQDPRSDAILETAHRFLQEVAARIEDEALRRSYLENVPAHRELIAVYREQHATQTITLPRAGAPLGRPLRDDEQVTVTWTVAAAEDEAIAGKAARRHHRLLRLLREAQAQGAVPSYHHLAEALGVHQRTIERDLALLRHQEDPLPPTRGTMSDRSEAART
jgi:DNA-binding SARP family transcriptional activator/Tfp pilus assembly protein PilF